VCILCCVNDMTRVIHTCQSHTGRQRDTNSSLRSAIAVSALTSRLQDLSTGLQMPTPTHFIVPRVYDHSIVDSFKFNLSPSAVRRSRLFGYIKDQNCGFRSSKLFRSRSVIVEQSAVGIQEVATDSWTVLQPATDPSANLAVIFLLLLDWNWNLNFYF